MGVCQPLDQIWTVQIKLGEREAALPTGAEADRGSGHCRRPPSSPVESNRTLEAMVCLRTDTNQKRSLVRTNRDKKRRPRRTVGDARRGTAARGTLQGSATLCEQLSARKRERMGTAASREHYEARLLAYGGGEAVQHWNSTARRRLGFRRCWSSGTKRWCSVFGWKRRERERTRDL